MLCQHCNDTSLLAIPVNSQAKPTVHSSFDARRNKINILFIYVYNHTDTDVKTLDVVDAMQLVA